jgi:hypothetical protein
LRDLAFPDPERLLRQRPEMLMTEARAESDFDVVAGICFFGMVMILMVICGRFIGSEVFVRRREELTQWMPQSWFRLARKHAIYQGRLLRNANTP